MKESASRVLEAAKKSDAAFTAVYQALQNANARDPKLVGALAQRYQVPHLLAVLGEAQGALMSSIAAYARENGDG